MNPRKLLRIARWEVLRNAGGVDRRTVILLVVGLALLGAVVPLAAGGDASLDEGIYRIHVDEDSRYHQVAAWDDTFAIRQADGPRAAVEGEVELYVGDGRIVRARTAKGDAAAQTFRNSVSQYNDRMMGREDNATAAFPVSVFLEYRQPTNVEVNVGGGSGGSGAGDGGSTDGGTMDGGSTDGAAPGGGSGGVGGGGGGGGLGGILAGSDSTSGSPSQISPPFPFQSLVLAFVFVIPLNFLVQAYGSTMLSERINRRGELMLVSPVTRTDIIGGKTLPYFLAALAVEAVIAGGVTFLRDGTVGGLVSVLAMVPLVLLFLGATFLGAMFARSFKELTFVTVTITVTLTSYAFVPAIFTESNAIALISPLTLVVRDLQNEAITLAEFAFSVTPPTLTALVTFALGAALYREEDMFAQRPIPLKLLDSLAGWIRKPWHAGLVSGMLLPFIFVAELLAIALLFAFGQLSVPILLVFVAIIEELGKSLHVYGAYGHGRFEPGWRRALVIGAFSGLGFFLAEKLTLMAHLVGLGDELVGQAALSTGLATPPVLALSLLAPLALHTVTAVLSALGASRGRRAYVVGLTLAVAVHLGYNLAVVSLVYV